MDPLAIAIDAARFAGLALAVWNCTWSVGGFRALTGGRHRPVDFYQSVVFVMALGVISFQSGYLFEGVEEIAHPRILMSAFIVAVGMGLAAWGNRMAMVEGAERFYRLYDHLDVALAAADHASVEPEEAEKMAEEARAKTARALIQGD